jgi:hypothetical protein
MTICPNKEDPRNSEVDIIELKDGKTEEKPKELQEH